MNIKRTFCITILALSMILSAHAQDVVVANFKSGWSSTNNTEASSPWKYYWNQPEGWVKDNPDTPGDEYMPGSPNSNNILDENSYSLLEYAVTLFTPDGDEFGANNMNFHNNPPAGFLRINANEGGTGGSNFDGSSTNLPKYLFDCYVILAYTVEKAGIYYVGNSSLAFNSPVNHGDGVRLMVLANDEDDHLFHQVMPNNGEQFSFDTSPMELEANDVIYVCIGPNENGAYDNFSIDFSIKETDEIPDPVTDFYVTDYGAVGDGVTNDFAAIRSAMSDFVMAKDTAYLHFEAGKTYRCEGSGHLFNFSSVKNKTIYGNEAMIIVQPSILGITIEYCENILVKDLIFDSDPLSWTQGTITAVDKSNKKFTLKIDPGYPIPTNNYSNPNRAHPWGMLWGAEDDNIKDELVFITASSIANGNSVDLTVREDMVDKLNNFVAGTDRFTVDTYGVGGTFNRISESKDITCENITIYATRALVFALLDNVGALHMNGIEMRRKPGTDRLLSAYRDGFHCKRNIEGPLIENCYIEGICDDAINLSGGYFYVTGISSDTQFQIDNPSNFEVGDTLLFVDMKNGVELGKTYVASVSGNNLTTSSAITGVVAGEPRASTTTFVMNLSKANSGFIIRNNTFARHRRYAMLIRSPNGLIENNTGEKLGGGIILTNEIVSFFEGPFPHNITIQNNSFTNIRRWPLWLKTTTYAPVPEQLVHDIRLYDNTFGPSDAGIAAATFDHVRNVELVGNAFVDHASAGGIAMKNSRKIIMCNNTYNGAPVSSIDDGIELISNMSESDVLFDCNPNSLKDPDKEKKTFYVYRDRELLHIISEKNISDLTLFDSSGRVVRKIPDGHNTINISGLSPGIYVVYANESDKNQVCKIVL